MGDLIQKIVRSREFISDLGGFEKFCRMGISIMAKTSSKEFKLVNVELFSAIR